MERVEEGYLTFLAPPGPYVEVFFLPTVLAGESMDAPYLQTTADIVGVDDGSDRLKPQFKKMFWRLLTLKANGCKAIKQILVFDNSLHIWFGDGIYWSDVGEKISLILHQGLYPGKKISINGTNTKT